MADERIRALAYDDNVRIVAAVSTTVVGDAMRIHDAGPTGAAALGRLLTATALLAATNKGAERLTLQVQGGGPLGLLLARTAGEGEVYGTVGRPRAHVFPRPDGKLDVGRGVGTDGQLMVVKDLGFGEPYIGTVPLVSGEIGDDVAEYLARSEQTLSAIGVGVRLSPQATCLGAGGFLVQILGGCDEEAFDAIEARIAELRELSRDIEHGASARDLVAMLAGGTERVLESTPLAYRCPLDRAYYAGRLRSLGREALAEAFGAQPDIEVVCEFSRVAHTFTREELDA